MSAFIGNMNAQCMAHINVSIIESIGHQKQVDHKYPSNKGWGIHCTIYPDNFGKKSIDSTLKSSDLLVIGDSQAQRHYYAINYAIQGEFRFRTLNLFGEWLCPFVFDVDANDRCAMNSKYTREMIIAMRPDYIFLIGYMEEYIKRFMKSTKSPKVCLEYIVHKKS
jgi:hypothetical protein